VAGPSRRDELPPTVQGAAGWVVRNPIIIAAIIAAIGGILAAVVTLLVGNGGKTVALQPTTASTTSRPREIRGRILSPRRGQRIHRSFTVEGTLSSVPDDRHVWVVVQIGNLLFPKEPEIPATDRHWAQDVVEGGGLPGGRLSLALFVVDRVGNRQIETWLEHGRSTGDYPGLTGIRHGIRLDVVTNLLLVE
jgi:hypothetical protein